MDRVRRLVPDHLLHEVHRRAREHGELAREDALAALETELAARSDDQRREELDRLGRVA